MYLNFLLFLIKSEHFIIFHLLKLVEQKKGHKSEYRDRSKRDQNPKYVKRTATLDRCTNITASTQKTTLETWLSLLLTDRLTSPGTVLPATPQKQTGSLLEQCKLLLAVILLGYSLFCFSGETICQGSRDTTLDYTNICFSQGKKFSGRKLLLFHQAADNLWIVDSLNLHWLLKSQICML